jgi:hypothetical protein
MRARFAGGALDAETLQIPEALPIIRDRVGLYVQAPWWLQPDDCDEVLYIPQEAQIVSVRREVTHEAWTSAWASGRRSMVEAMESEVRRQAAGCRLLVPIKTVESHGPGVKSLATVHLLTGTVTLWPTWDELLTRRDLQEV